MPQTPVVDRCLRALALVVLLRRSIYANTGDVIDSFKVHRVYVLLSGYGKKPKQQQQQRDYDFLNKYGFGVLLIHIGTLTRNGRRYLYISRSLLLAIYVRNASFIKLQRTETCRAFSQAREKCLTKDTDSCASSIRAII